MTLPLIYGAVFAAVLLLAETLLRLLARRRRAATEINERMRRMREGQGQEDIFQSLLKDRAADGASAFEWLNLRKLYRQSGLALNLRQRVSYVLLIALVCLLVSILFTPLPWLRLVIVAGGTLGIVILFLFQARRRRRLKFVMQMPDSIDIIVRSISAGHPVNSAISLVAREMPDPIGSEFGLLSDQLTFGSEIDEALISMVDRVGVDELNLLAVTMGVQKSSGGNLTEILQNLSRMVRERAIMKAKIKAVSAEGRITAMVMAVFPFLLYLMINALMPTYFDPVWETGNGFYIVLGTLAYMSIGVIILYRLVKFDF